MPKVRFKGSDQGGAILNVGADSALLNDPKYEVVNDTPTGIQKPSGGGLTIPDPGLSSSEQLTTIADFQGMIDNIGKSPEDIAAKATRDNQIKGSFDPLFDEARTTGTRREGVARGIFGQSELPGLSLILEDEVVGIAKDVEKSITFLTNQMNRAILDGDTAASDKAKGSLKLAADLQNQVFNQKLALQTQRLNELNAKTNATSNAFDIVSNLPAGKTFTAPDGTVFTGIASEEIDPFFSGSDIISAMKALAPGQTTTLVDPNTGVEWEIEGVGKDDKDRQIFRSVNNNTGDETFSVFENGEMVNQIKSIGTGEQFKPTGGTKDGDITKDGDLTADFIIDNIGNYTKREEKLDENGKKSGEFEDIIDISKIPKHLLMEVINKLKEGGTLDEEDEETQSTVDAFLKGTGKIVNSVLDFFNN